MEAQLKVIGVLLIALGLAHSIFPRYFKWKNDMLNVSLINRQLLYVHTFFIALMLFLMGLLCLTSSSELITTKLGKQILLGFAIFWFARLLIQFFGYSPVLWKGKRFETFMHVMASVLWFYLSAVFSFLYLNI